MAEYRKVDLRLGSDRLVKLSADLYRKGGARVLLLDGHEHAVNLHVIRSIREAGLKAWRTGDQVWVLRADLDAINALPIGAELQCGRFAV